MRQTLVYGSDHQRDLVKKFVILKLLEQKYFLLRFITTGAGKSKKQQIQIKG